MALLGLSPDTFDWPQFGLEDDIRPALGRARAAGEMAALATLYAVEGGAPRGVGAQMLFSGGALTGYLSGGCVEADVARHAAAVLAEGAPRRLVYGQDGPPDIRLSCGSRIEVLVEALAPDDAAARDLLALSEQRANALWLSDGRDRACVSPDAPLPTLPEALRRAAQAVVAVCGFTPSPFAIRRPYQPSPRLIVVGDDPIALALIRFAGAMGIETALIRPKGPETPPDLGLQAYLRGDPEAGLAALKPDLWTAIAVLSHDADVEHGALLAALATPARYVGALGSRRRFPERLERLRSAGVRAEDLARIRAPIGLPIGGKSPWEIAVSILAEIVEEGAGAKP